MTPCSSAVNPVPVPVPVPEEMKPLPEFLTFKQVVRLCGFWNLGNEGYVRDLRDLGRLVSVTEFKLGQRARYGTETVLGLYREARGGVR